MLDRLTRMRDLSGTGRKRTFQFDEEPKRSQRTESEESEGFKGKESVPVGSEKF
jgi:hypothetical protein